MPRFHLFEFEDQPWFPRRLRNAMTAYLTVAYQLTPLPKIWASRLSAILAESGQTEIVDLCSGSTGPMLAVAQELENAGHRPTVTLTDLYPNPAALGPGGNRITYRAKPVDATRVPSSLRGVRTMFSAFHHFRPRMARQILEDAYTQRRPICVFESTSGSGLALLHAIGIPIAVLILTPLVRPVSLFQLLFTYLIPILPLLILWDGLVSNLRVYSCKGMEELTRGLDNAGYRWEFGRLPVPRMPGGVAYLIGAPVK